MDTGKMRDLCLAKLTNFISDCYGKTALPTTFS